MANKICGIYKITNKLTGESYIGLSTDIRRRVTFHKTSSGRIHEIIKKYGVDNFSFEVLEECSLEELPDKEKYYIKLYDAENNGMNLTSGGEIPFNTTGYYRVHKHDEKTSIGYTFRYTIKIQGKITQIRNKSLVELEKKVKERNLPWEILDKEKAYDTLQKNLEDLTDLKKNNPKNTTGYYHVYKVKSNHHPQGFIWNYHYHDEGKQKSIARIDLNKLKEVVLARGFKWMVVDEDKAKLSDKENEKAVYLNNHHVNNNTGFYRVSKVKCTSCLRGFSYGYFYQQEGKRKQVYSVNLEGLEKKVKDRGLEWRIIDNKLAEKTIAENNNNQKRLSDYY